MLSNPLPSPLPGLSNGKCVDDVSILRNRVYVGAVVYRQWLNRPGVQRPAGPGEKQNEENAALVEE